MEVLLEPYRIDFPNFTQHIQDCRALVAGSFALVGYLTQLNVDPGFQANDMDIFISGINNEGNEDNDSVNNMIQFLNSQGFTENGKFANQNLNQSQERQDQDNYYGTMNLIRRVMSFTNANDKEIQMIVLNYSADNLRWYIGVFDLSCCQCYWEAFTNTFHAISHLTNEKKMYVNPVRKRILMDKRIEKYQARGFKLVEYPCDIQDGADPRSDLASLPFDGLTAHNILTMDDVSVSEFLAESEWNIVLKTGDQFYAFDRKILMELMGKKKVYIPHVGYVYDTLLNQSITEQAFKSLKYSDYSIYELKLAYSTRIIVHGHHYDFNETTKSLYTVIAYSVNKWAERLEGVHMAPLPQPQPQPRLSPKPKRYDRHHMDYMWWFGN